MKTQISADIFAIVRHRIPTDGDGVTTLVGLKGCPLACKYCLNPQCRTANSERLTADELFEKVRIDDLYFTATGGGITFGGGEPLLHADFILDFINRAKPRADWKFTLETSLAVTLDNAILAVLAEKIDLFIVDVKDTDPAIYRPYTGGDVSLVLRNLESLADLVHGKIRVKLPLIPGFNTEKSLDKSEQIIKNLGISQIARFNYIIPEKVCKNQPPRPT